MSWIIYNQKLNLYDGAYEDKNSAIFYRNVLTSLWKGSCWDLYEDDDYPENRFHGDHEDLLVDEFGTEQRGACAEVVKMMSNEKRLVTAVRWVGDLLVVEIETQTIE